MKLINSFYILCSGVRSQTVKMKILEMKEALTFLCVCACAAVCAQTEKPHHHVCIFYFNKHATLLFVICVCVRACVRVCV